MYVSPNFKTKRELKEAVAHGKEVMVFQPGLFGDSKLKNRDCCVEGPHYPKPHTWYARVTVTDGKITKVK